jgi:hypothetical protein
MLKFVCCKSLVNCEPINEQADGATAEFFEILLGINKRDDRSLDVSGKLSPYCNNPRQVRTGDAGTLCAQLCQCLLWLCGMLCLSGKSGR